MITLEPFRGIEHYEASPDMFNLLRDLVRVEYPTHVKSIASTPIYQNPWMEPGTAYHFDKDGNILQVIKL